MSFGGHQFRFFRVDHVVICRRRVRVLNVGDRLKVFYRGTDSYQGRAAAPKNYFDMYVSGGGVAFLMDYVILDGCWVCEWRTWGGGGVSFSCSRKGEFGAEGRARGGLVCRFTDLYGNGVVGGRVGSTVFFRRGRPAVCVLLVVGASPGWCTGFAMFCSLVFTVLLG